MNTVFDKKTGKKMYPIGSWLKYSHIFYNYNDRCYNAMYDTDHSIESIDKFEEAERLLDVFEHNPRVNGIVYVIYDDYKKMKDIIGAYALRHNGCI